MAIWIQDIKGCYKVSVFALIALVILLLAAPVVAAEKADSFFKVPAVTEFEVGFEKMVASSDDLEKLDGATAYALLELDLHKYLITEARVDTSFNDSGLNRDEYGTVGVWLRPFQTKRTEFLIGGSTVIPIGENAMVNTDEYVLAVRFRLK